MAIKKYVAISYCFAFLFVYFISLAYAFLSTGIGIDLPQTTAMNSTTTALSSFSSWGGTLTLVGIIVLIIAILFIINSFRMMRNAI